jgi:predicted transcriptional regulator
MTEEDRSDSGAGSAHGDDGRPASKVARLIDSYELGTAFGDRLETLWTAEGDRRESLRSLADRFNKRLLEETMVDAGMSTIEGEIDNLYRLLTDDDVSSGARTEARMRLTRNGVDVDGLERDFVTYQAIRSYLKDYRGTEYEGTDDRTRVESVVETIQRLRSRTRSVAQKSLSQLADTGHLSIGEFRVFVDITVLCEECNTQYGIVELLEAGRCDCRLEDGDE